jgi:hypothetical protein
MVVFWKISLSSLIISVLFCFLSCPVNAKTFTIECNIDTDESLDRIVVKVGNESKTIQTQGSCS